MMPDEPAVGSRWWLGGLIAFAVGGIVVAAARPGPFGSAAAAPATAMLIAYVVLFATVTRRARADSPAAVVSIIATLVLCGGLIAVAPTAALLQFWAYPLIWMLLSSITRALLWTAAMALAVFAGLAIASLADEEGPWLVSAALTVTVSYLANVFMGLWITSIYRRGLEHEALVAELTEAQQQLAAISHESGATAERERLSREMHDTIAQSLAGTVLLAQRARREHTAGKLSAGLLEMLEESARAALTETRTLVAGSAPASVGSAGLVEALRLLAARCARESEIEVDVTAEPMEELSREVEVVLLRCAQEGLSNARRHAHPRRISIVLGVSDRHVQLSVRDDGVGFDPHADTEGFGLTGLRTRVGQVGGEIEVDGTPGAAVLCVRLPTGMREVART